jgi:hypothetical protein
MSSLTYGDVMQWLFLIRKKASWGPMVLRLVLLERIVMTVPSPVT